MEVYLLYYGIAVLSFAIMYTYSYGYETIRIVNEVLLLFDMEDVETEWCPICYLIATFLLSLVVMPVLVIIMFRYNKWDTVQLLSGRILNKYFDFKE